MRTKLQFLTFMLALAVVTFPTLASAQWRYPPYPAYRYAGAESNLRINVKPKQASVYVDGYFAGRVDEFNGKFQRLHMLPGEHEITIYLEGYRSLKQRLYLGPNATRTMDGELERLAPGEAQEPQPQPSHEPEDRVGPPDQGYRIPPEPGVRTRRPPGPPDQPPFRRGPQAEPSEPSQYASLSIRVQPPAAVVRIDGERWDGPADDERLIVQVAEGHHVIEVEREGYEQFRTEVDVRSGETVPVNVSLRRR